MNSKPLQTVLLFVNDESLSYLFSRFTERSAYQMIMARGETTLKDIKTLAPTLLLFSSTTLLEKVLTRIGELTSLETPIVVCTSSTEEARARDLGADYCLLHPLTYDDFQNMLARVSMAKSL